MASLALHPSVREHVAALARLGEMALELGGEAIPSRLRWADCQAELAALDVVKQWAPGVFSVPFISEGACAALTNWANKYAYRVNSEEDAAYQIPELVIAHKHEDCQQDLKFLWEELLRPVFRVMYRLDPQELSSIQLARYSPAVTSKGNWHRDEDSDCTAVVNLGTEHVGGGTRLFVGGAPVLVPPLPAGHALLFLGRTVMHCGAEITDGQRDLLVYWSKL